MSTNPRIAMKWCRLYAEFALDPKVQSMNEAMQRRLCMLFCLQTAGMLAGIDDAELAATLRISADALTKTKDLFLKKGFIGDDWTITNWEKRQYRSDSSTGRTRKHKERRNAERSANVPGTFPERPGNGPETETETESESEAEAAWRQQQSESENTPPPFPINDDELTIHPGQYAHDPAEAARLWLDIWRGYRSERLCRQWYEKQKAHSIAAWRAAFIQVNRYKTTFTSIRYVDTIARSFDAQGRRIKPSPDGNPFAVDADAEHQKTLELARRRFGPRGEMIDARS